MDLFCVLLKEGYTVADFESRAFYSTRLWLFSKLFQIDYVGGQNRMFIVRCRESFLHSWLFIGIIDSYSPISSLARIDNTLISELSSSLSNSSELSISIEFFSTASPSLDSLYLILPTNEFSHQNTRISDKDIVEYLYETKSKPSEDYSYPNNKQAISISPDDHSSSVYHIYGQPSSLLPYLSSLLCMKGIQSISLKPVFQFSSLRSERICFWSCKCAGRLNEHMRQYMTDGQYSIDGESAKILNQYDLHIFLLCLCVKFLHLLHMAEMWLLVLETPVWIPLARSSMIAIMM